MNFLIYFGDLLCKKYIFFIAHGVQLDNGVDPPWSFTAWHLNLFLSIWEDNLFDSQSVVGWDNSYMGPTTIIVHIRSMYLNGCIVYNSLFQFVIENKVIQFQIPSFIGWDLLGSRLDHVGGTLVEIYSSTSGTYIHTLVKSQWRALFGHVQIVFHGTLTRVLND